MSSDEDEAFRQNPIYYKMFCTPDFKYIAEKRVLAADFGCKAGIVGGLGSIVVNDKLNFATAMLYNKRWMLLTIGKGALAGAATGLVYAGAVQAACQVRNKDDFLNHFIGGFAGLSIPVLVLQKDYRFYMMIGCIVATLTAIAKIGGQSAAIPNSFRYRRERIGETKFPEIYLHNEVRKDIQRMKKEGKWISPFTSG